LPFPAQSGLTYPLEQTGDDELMGLYAGQSATLTRDLSASELIEVLVKETNQTLTQFTPQNSD
jgi:hypothetical protein